MASKWVPKLILTEEQWEAFVEEAKKLDDYWASLLLFIAYTGCRVSEAATLLWERVNFETREALIWRSKRGKSRYVPLHPIVIKYLNKIKPKEPRGWVWPSRKPKRTKRGHVSTRAIEYKIKEIGERIGVRNLHPHALRHTVASLMLAKGVDPPTVRDILGHSSLQVTDIYSHAYPEARKRAIMVLK